MGMGRHIKQNINLITYLLYYLNPSIFQSTSNIIYLSKYLSLHIKHINVIFILSRYLIITPGQVCCCGRNFCSVVGDVYLCGGGLVGVLYLYPA